MPETLDHVVNPSATRRPTNPARLALVLILISFVGLATLYNVTNPLFEAPDEIWHYFFTQELRANWQLPVQSHTRGGVWGQQEGGQPPLYYAAGAALTFWIPSHPAEQWIRPNDHAAIGAPSAADNKNRFVHGAAESFPYRDDFLAAHLVRFLSTLFGAGTIILTYLIARTVWPANRWLAVGAAAVNAFIPQFVYIAAAVNNDVAAAFFCSAALLVSLRVLQAGVVEPRRLLLLGTLAGLATLTKTAALPALGLAAGVPLLIALRRRSVRVVATSILTAVLPFVAITGWWFWRNVALYGDWLPLRVFLDRASLDDQIPTLAEIISDLAGLRYSFWALFGWFNIMVDQRLYLAFDGLLLLSLLGWVVTMAVGARREMLSLQLLVVAAWACAIVVALLRYRLIVQAFQGRLLFPAISSISILLFFGLAALLPPRRTNIAAVFIGCSLTIVAMMMPFQYLRPNYERPMPLSTLPQSRDFRPSGAQLGTALELAGYQLREEVVASGQPIDVTLYWRAVEGMTRDYSVFVQLLDWQGKVVDQKDSFPGGGRNATSLWQPGEVIADSYRLHAPVDSTQPELFTLQAGLYQKANLARLPVRLQGADSGNAILLGKPHVAAPPAYYPRFMQKLDLNFGDKARLVGFTMAQQQVVAGGVIGGTLYWQALNSIDKDLTVFVQLVGPSGLVAQSDSQPRNGAYPTSAWLVGDEIGHPFAMTVPPSLVGGDYHLIVGLYDLTSGQRMPTGNSDYAELSRWTLPQ